jgi:hypothetical protein
LHLDGRSAGVVVLESNTLIHARMKAAVYEADQRLDFTGAHQFDEVSARRIPKDMIGRLPHATWVDLLR